MPVPAHTTSPHGVIIKPHQRKWWKEAVVYQIYPASFKDSNGDGVGDLQGIISKLDYLKELGVDVVWLSPIFASPQVDMGYDISDYKLVDPRYGTNEDVTTLIAELHKRGMKLLLDLVVNHSSDQHAWFQESLAAPAGSTTEQGSKRDWYIWRKGHIDEKTGERRPPNNWQAVFGGSVWEWHEPSQEYYLHYFCPEQPDLNWENPALRQAVWDVMKFWLDQGVDGFRMDVINMISKHLDFPDAEVTRPKDKWQPPGDYVCNGPRMHEFLQEMNREVISKYDMMNVGEMPSTRDAKTVLEYVHESRNELQMVFEFNLVDLDHSGSESWMPRKWELREFKKIIADWATGLYDGGWAAFYLENHDQCRSTSRWASDSPEYRWLSAKMLALLELTSFGTPYIYQGQELGQINLPQDYPEEELVDVQSINRIADIRAKGWPNVEQEVQGAISRARDHARAPFQWSAGEHAGFSNGPEKPWMLPSPDHKICNAESQMTDRQSVLAWYKRLIKLRKDLEALVYGRFELISEPHNDVFAYTRTVINSSTGQEESVLIALNFTAKLVPSDVSDEVLRLSRLGKAEYVVGTYEGSDGFEEPRFEGSVINLKPYEGVLFRL